MRDRHAGKVAKADQRSHGRINRIESAQRLVEGQRVVGPFGICYQVGIERLTSEFPPELTDRLTPGIVHQDPPNRLGRRGEEVATIFKMLIAHQSQVGFMHQGRGIKCLPRFLVRELLRRESAQLSLNQRHELPSGVRVALLDLI